MAQLPEPTVTDRQKRGREDLVSQRSSGAASRPRHVRRWRLLPAAIPLVALVFVVAGCGAGTSSPSPTVAPPTDTASPTATPTPTPDPTAAIVNEYEQGETTFGSLAAIPQDDAAAYAKLQQWFTGGALTLGQETLEVYVVQGERLTGDLRFGSAIVTSLQTSTATLQDCDYTTRATISIATGQDVGASTTGYVLDTATLVLQGGSWHVSADQQKWQGANGCSASPSP